MKVLFLLSFVILTVSAQAQMKVEREVIRKNDRTKTIVTQPPPPAVPPPPPPAAASGNGLSEHERAMLEAWQGYFLEAVRVVIHTGNDSKELPSSVAINLVRPEGNSFVELFNSIPNNTNTYEFKANTTTGFNLTSNYLKPTATPLQAEYRSGNAGGYRWYEVRMKNIEESGLRLKIVYSPNFLMDAWKVEKVTMVLYFRDILGRPHPTLGSKEVVFSRPKLFTNGDRSWVLETDGSFMPK